MDVALLTGTVFQQWSVVVREMQRDNLPPCGHCTTINVVRIRLSVDIYIIDTVLEKGVTFKDPLKLNATGTFILLPQGQWMALLGKEKVYTCVFPPSSLVYT